MNEMGCDTVRDRIPTFVRGTLNGEERTVVEAHMRSCAECSEEADLVALLGRTAPEVPGGLSARIGHAVRVDARRGTRTGSSRPWWGLAAAAVAAVSLGIGVTTHNRSMEAEPLPSYVAGNDTHEDVWLSDDGLIAGAPALDDLSAEDLNTLLTEMTVGGQA